MKKPFSILQLHDFMGGNLTVNAQYGVMYMTNMVKTQEPGVLVVTNRFRGPKEWSPHGTVPDGWMEIYRFKEGCSSLSAFYQKQDGIHTYESFPLIPRGPQGIYFAPWKPGEPLFHTSPGGSGKRRIR